MKKVIGAFACLSIYAYGMSEVTYQPSWVDKVQCAMYITSSMGATVFFFSGSPRFKRLAFSARPALAIFVASSVTQNALQFFHKVNS